MEPRSVVITGSFHNQRHKPAHGMVQFIPGRLWVMSEGTAWASLAPKVRLDADGSFVVRLTPTDSDAIMWSYRLYSPAGMFKVNVPYREAGLSLRELLYGYRVGKSA